MAEGVRTPRSRGGLSGLALILLGAWGGIAPYAGPLALLLRVKTAI